MPDVILLGAPGAGKGTQAQLLQREYGFAAISTGDLLRDHRARGTTLGQEAESFMQRGELVPDDVIIRMVESELPGKPVLFDGFPRTVAQAQALDALFEARRRPLPIAAYLKLDRARLEERLLGRWTNPRSGRVYHATFDPPKRSGIDDVDGGPLIQREDDRPETIARRLDVFEGQTLPLVAYYEAGNRLILIDAAQSVDAVSKALVAGLGLHQRAR
ncbi:MAG: adenylate kinase [Vulcanimicrobiaceae bacterium]